MMKPQIQLEVSNRYKSLRGPIRPTQAICSALEESGMFPIGQGELSIVFVSDPMIGSIHADFMDDPTPTDVITFPADPTMESVGEIIVSVDHAKERADALGEPFSRELTLYIVHGWLHLSGFDDRTPADRARMREAEQRALRVVDQAGAADGFALKE